MKKLVMRLVIPILLAFGLAGGALAGGYSGHGGHGGSGGGIEDIDKAFAKLFLGDAGESFAKVVNFKVDELSLITLNIASIGLEDLSVSIFQKKSSTGVYDSGSFGSASGSVWSDSFSLDAGKYFMIFTGSVASAAAGYVGTLSAAPVPEPAEGMMIVAGVAMMGFVVARRRQV
ncbi:MAG: hypothetical protein E6R11_07745 [Rhodocyclaceae bacterium]|nr:MAG: hypothetical protein E6R11_07745 [Rhodocyclaceae bacterium]